MQPHSLLTNPVAFYVTVAVVFVLMISILVFAHELGHYVFARAFNMGVEEFAIGFGKNPLVTYAKRNYVIQVQPGEDPTLPHARPEDDINHLAANVTATMEGVTRATHSQVVETASGRELHETTNFTVRPIPAGGFVRIKGMLPEEDGSETRIPGGFYSKAPWKRFIVLLAGPAFSVLTGILILVPVFMQDGIRRLNPEPILGTIAVGMPADKAGLEPGDKILTLKGKPIARFYDMIKVVRDSAGVDLPMTYQRKGKIYSTTVRPQYEAEPSNVMDEDLSVTPDVKIQSKIFAGPVELTVHPSVGEALSEAVKAPIDTVVGIAKIFQKPARFGTSVNGPVQMAGITAGAVRSGALRVIELMAYLSISVGIFNLLPFPPLDGGQMAICFAEMLRGGRRLSIQIQGLMSTVGMLAVVLLMVSALYVDVKQLSKPASKPLVTKTK
jgi:regulator of sigma E protease